MNSSDSKISLDNLGEEILNTNNDNLIINLKLEEPNSSYIIKNRKKKVK